jgi:hypothetical protein
LEDESGFFGGDLFGGCREFDLGFLGDGRDLDFAWHPDDNFGFE